jgi:hypothetical protein
MPSSENRSVILTFAIVILVAVGVYLIDPTFFGLFSAKREGFEGTMSANANSTMRNPMDLAGPIQMADTSNEHSVGGDLVEAMKRQMENMRTETFEGEEEEPEENNEGFDNMNNTKGPADFNSAANPPGCYPRDQLTAGDLLPKDTNSVWAQQNPMGNGSLKGKNFLSAGALIGINTVGQSLRNANYQLRSEPPNPQVPVTVFNNSTIEPDTNRRDLEIS